MSWINTWYDTSLENNNGMNLIDESKKTETDKINDNINQFIENTESILSNINSIEYDESTHPKYKEFYEWILSNSLNEKWFETRQDNILLVDWWIQILGDTFLLEDEIASDWDWIINIDWNTYFTPESASKHIEGKDLKLISNKDIDKYVNFLPWNIDNKLAFFQNILNFKLNWYYDPTIRIPISKWRSALYITSKHITFLNIWEIVINRWVISLWKFNLDESIIQWVNNSKLNYYSLRCLKNNS